LGNLPAKISAVVSNKKNCGAIDFAVDKNIPTFIIVNSKDENLVSYIELLNFLSELKIDIIVLAGFLKKIPNEFIKVYKNKIINIHPALLPKFGGKGMYGKNVHKAVFEAKETISGATVHFVDEIYDNGKIIEQSTIDISDVESPEEIAERVLRIEHTLLPGVIKKIATGSIKLNN
jgi:formyltetrahydrofolate-dependent phosphoribosylglycinamide formyltransferase